MVIQGIAGEQVVGEGVGMTSGVQREGQGLGTRVLGDHELDVVLDERDLGRCKQVVGEGVASVVQGEGESLFWGRPMGYTLGYRGRVMGYVLGYRGRARGYVLGYRGEGDGLRTGLQAEGEGLRTRVKGKHGPDIVSSERDFGRRMQQVDVQYNYNTLFF